MTSFTDGRGFTVKLGSLLGRGGEGEVFALNDHEAAKVFHANLAPRKAPKIAAMVRSQSPALLKVAAWPLSTLHASGGPVVGAIMPRLRSYWEIHEIYTPQSRRVHFPRADWRFLIRVAANLARAFAVVHDAGHVIGDINFKNVVVYRNTTVTLIDCDSFQIDADGQRYLCEVGVPEFTAPELLNGGQNVLAGPRTIDHDNFGLAVLIFHLLFLGRHPFTGIYLGAGEMSLMKAIQERRFAYGAAAGVRFMKPPKGSLPLEAVPQLAGMFEQAFTSTGSPRPTALAWMSALEQIVGKRNDRSGCLKTCSHNAVHHYVADLTACPWCALESTTKFPIFGFTPPVGGLSIRSAVAVAQKIPPLEATVSKMAGVSASPGSSALVALQKYEVARKKVDAWVGRHGSQKNGSSSGTVVSGSSGNGTGWFVLAGLSWAFIGILPYIEINGWGLLPTAMHFIQLALLAVGIVLFERGVRRAQGLHNSAVDSAEKGQIGDERAQVMAMLEALLLEREEVVKERDSRASSAASRR